MVEHVERNRIDKIRLFIEREAESEEKNRQSERAAVHSMAGEA